MHLWLQASTFLVAFLFAITSNAAAEVCPPETVMPKKPTRDVNSVQEKLKESFSAAENYFVAACRLDQGTEKDPMPEAVKDRITQALKNRPDTQFMQTLVPLMDKAGHRTQDFLQKVHDRIKARHKHSQDLASAFESCTRNPENARSASCAGVNSWLSTHLQQILQLSRFNLAMAHPTPTPSLFEGKNEIELNATLNTRKSAKALPWKPMQGEELAIAKQSFTELQKTARETVDRTPGLSPKQQEQMYKEELLKIRHVYHTMYLGFLGINPILQNIQSAQPSREEIHKAAQTTLASLKKEKDFLNDRQSLISKKFTLNEKTVSPDRELLDLMNYHTEVEEVLLENPEYCGLGVTLSQIQANRGTEHSLMMGLSALPIMAASLPFSAPTAMGIGSLGTAFFYYDANQKYQTDLSRETARVQREGLAEFKQVIAPDPVTGKPKTVDELRIALQKDVTQVYRANLQKLNQGDSERTTAVATGATASLLPFAGKLIGSYVRSTPRISVPSK